MEFTFQRSKKQKDVDQLGEPKNTEVEIEKQKFQASLSPEYKSSWNEINIQGDYDHYARSAAPSRRLQNDNITTKKENTPSPRSKESEATNESPQPKTKRNRVKLSKAESQPVRNNPTPSVTEVETGERTKIMNSKGTRKRESTSDESTGSKTDLTAMKPKEPVVSSGFSTMLDETLKSIEEDQSNLKDSNKEPEMERMNHQLPSHWSRTSNKSCKEFSPPIVTAVDFHEPGLSQAVKFATRNGLLVEGSENWHKDRMTQDGNVSRLSTLFMANYLGVGHDRSPNVVTSIVVKPLLPPLNLKKPRVRRRLVNKKSTPEEIEFQISPEKRQAEKDGKATTESPQLAPLRDSHLYKWKHSELVSNLNNDENSRRMDAKQTPYRLQHREGNTESAFDHIVRWRSKVRYCGKPAMYRRITSPTLGEVALRRKLTDRLPTPQALNNRPSDKDLQPQGGIESWRRSRSRLSVDPSVKQFIKQKLRDAQKDGSSPNIIEGFYDVTMNMKQASLRQRLEARNKTKDVMKIPLPDLSLRKRQPVWQRMR